MFCGETGHAFHRKTHGSIFLGIIFPLIAQNSLANFFLNRFFLILPFLLGLLFGCFAVEKKEERTKEERKECLEEIFDSFFAEEQMGFWIQNPILI